MAIHIITDSTSDISQIRAKELNITVVPLTLTFGEEEFIDGVTIHPKEFFDRMRATTDPTKLPKTSQVTVASFLEAYGKLTKNDKDEVIAIHLSSDLSGTFQSATIAKETLGKKNITLIDSRQVTFGLALLVEYAIQLRNEGKTAKQIVEEIEAIKNKVVVHAVIDDLRYLKMGGRLSGTSAAIGQLLNLKPIIVVANGKVSSVHKTLGMVKAFHWMIEQYQSVEVDTTKPRLLGHSDALTALGQFTQVLKTKEPSFPVERVYEIGIVVGTHAGPGAVGLAYIKK